MTTNNTKRVMVPLWGDAGPMTEIEAELDDLERSWADFAYAINPDGVARVVRRTDGTASVRTSSLEQVHWVLDHYRRKLDEDEDRSAIFDALVYCAEENVPMPYWVGSALLDIAKQLHQAPTAGQRPKSLHALFGMEKRFPTSPTKANKATRDLQLRGRLWSTTSRLMHAESISLDAALTKACKQLRFPYGKTKARQMFDQQERIQRGYLDARAGKHIRRRVHRIE